VCRGRGGGGTTADCHPSAARSSGRGVRIPYKYI